MKAPVGGAKGRQDIDTVGTGTNLTALPQRNVAPQISESQDYDQALKLKLIGKFRKLDTTPNVINNEHWRTQNTVPITITDFDGGQDGHHIYVLGDGQTTIDNNANIVNVSGAPILLTLGQVFDWVNVEGVWFQGGNAIGGGGGGGAPANAPFVTMALDAGLTNERVLSVVGGELDLVDGGPNAPVTLGLPAVGVAGTYTKVTTDVNGRVSAGGSLVTTDLPAAARRKTVAFNLGGAGVAITTGNKQLYIQIPFACTIIEWTILADQVGSIVLDIWKDTYVNFPPTVADTITAAAKPSIAADDQNTSSVLTGWTTAVVAGDILNVNVDSVSSITKAILLLYVDI